jgi:hypothetical protein
MSEREQIQKLNTLIRELDESIVRQYSNARRFKARQRLAYDLMAFSGPPTRRGPQGQAVEVPLVVVGQGDQRREYTPAKSSWWSKLIAAIKRPVSRPAR